MNIGFNPAAYQPYTGIELLAAADYPVVIEDVVAERAKDPASGLLKITFAVAQGHPNVGRKLFYRLNLWNVSEDSKATAHKQLTSLCYAVGITGVLNDTDELKGRQCIIAVTNDGQYNNVKIVKDMNGNEPGKGPAQQAMPGAPGTPQFGGAAPSHPGSFNPGAMPAGAMPAGFTPGQPQQYPVQQQPQQQPFQPGQTAPPQNAPQYGMQQQFPPQQQQPQQGQPPAQQPGNPFGGAPVQQQQPQQFQGQPQQGTYQPQAQQPANPQAGFQPGGQAQAPPQFFPQG